MLPNGNFALFPKKPKNKWATESFYCKKEVLLKDSLQDMMKTISRDASLHQIYTYHCIRVSLIKCLKENDVPNDKTEAGINQKSDTSIERYNKSLTSCKKRKISETIAEQVRGSSALSVTLKQIGFTRANA